MNIEIANLLKKNYPTARPGFIEILVEALELHAKKNHDYNGKKVLFPADVESLFYDLQRKFGRLYNLLSNWDEGAKVEESLKDTASDLGVYAFLMAEELKKEGGDIDAKV